MDHVQSAKEVVRHVLFRTSSLDRVYRLSRRKHADSTAGTLTDHFTRAYERRLWVDKPDQTSLSGIGSEEAATASLVRQLPSLLATLRCQHLLDIGCGDFNWMKDVHFDGTYTGCDVVERVILANQSTYGTAQRNFLVLDATSDPLPPADVVLCREVLFHLSHADGRKVLRNIKRSTAQYLIATTDSGLWFNSDIRSGDFRNINLQRRPYHFPPPICALDDSFVRADRVLGVWKVADLPGEPAATRSRPLP